MVEEERQNAIDPSEIEKAHTETAQRLKELITANNISAKLLDCFAISREGTYSFDHAPWMHFRKWTNTKQHQPFLNASTGGLPGWLEGHIFELTAEGRFRCYYYYSYQYGPHPDQRELRLRKVDIPPETNFTVLEEDAKLLIEDLKKLKLKDRVSPDGLPEDIVLVDQPRRYTHSTPPTP